MSTHPLPNERLATGRWAVGLLVVGLVVLGLTAASAPLDPPQFFRAYLAAYLFYLGITLGSLAFLMIYQLTGGAWGYLVRRVLEAATRTLPLVAVLFVPIAVGLPHLYPWARPELVEASESLRHKQIYLNDAFFWVRAGAYFVLWGGFAYLLNRASRRQDRTADPTIADRLGYVSGLGLVAYGITMMFSSVDWVMSIEPDFRSTIFGPLFASSQLLSSFAFVLVVLSWLRPRPEVQKALSSSVVNDLGNILLTFVVIWAYMEFFQFMLIWIANLPHEVIYYLQRSRGGWFWVTMSLVFLGFLVPFFALLSRDLKQDLAGLSSVAGLILIMHLVFQYYQVMPFYPNTTLADHWMDFLTPVGIGGLWLAYFLWQLQRWPLFVANDVNRETAARLRQAALDEAAHEKEIDND